MIEFLVLPILSSAPPYKFLIKDRRCLKKVTLPHHGEMLARLKRVYTQNGKEDELYVFILADAGQELDPEGVALGLCLALDEYKQNVPTALVAIGIYLPEFIDVLIDDPEARQAAHVRMKQIYPSLYPEGKR